MPRLPARPLVLILLLLLPALVFGPAFVRGEAFVPADLLSYLSPYRAHAPAAADAAPWNVLRFDGITQFYPWRLQAAREFRAGRIPLVNPYQFAAEGGTPLLANSQSAPLYPPNVVFWWTPPDRFWLAFGLSGALHLLIAATGLYALLRSLGLGRGACALGAATFALSGPVVCWLSLPTFLAVTSWLPWLLLAVRRAHTRAGTPSGRRSVVLAGLVGGLMLLAGHLQIALYGLLTAAVYAVWLGATSAALGVPGARRSLIGWAGGVAAAGVLALMIAAPQVLPSVALSRVSHRTVTRSMDLYRANMGTALPARNLVTLLAPDFFGHPNRGVYWNDSDRGGNNYAEWALYVGVLPLLLAGYALALPWRRRDAEPDSQATLPPERGFFALLAALALLLALGTPLNLLLFWGVPGFASTGNPARVLVVLALALSGLAAIGAHALTTAVSTGGAGGAHRRAALIAVVVPVFLAAFGLSRAAVFARQALPPETPLAAALQQATPGMMVAAVLLVLSAAAIALLPRLLTPERRPLALAALVALVIADLGFWGGDFNPTAKPERVYPVTTGIRYLQQNAANALIAPINYDWALGQTPPRGAVFPPNGLTVYGLHDVGGYDSLFPAKAKERVSQANGEDASPPANGNMVFVKSVPAAVALGARFIVLAPDALPRVAPPGSLDALRQVYAGEDMVILENPQGSDFVPAVQEARQATDSFRVGLFLAGCALSVTLGAATAKALRAPFRRRRLSG